VRRSPRRATSRGAGARLALPVGAGGKILLTSTAGRPSGFFYELVRNPQPETWIYHSTDNENPRADQGLVGFLKRQLALISPTAARRELGNEFTEDGDSFLAAALIEAAIDDELGQWPGSPLPAFAFLDLSRKRDLTSRVVVVRVPARRAEAHDHLVLASLRTWDPKHAPDGQVEFAEVRQDLAALPERFRTSRRCSWTRAPRAVPCSRGRRRTRRSR
jgi:hypothetical protein